MVVKVSTSALGEISAQIGSAANLPLTRLDKPAAWELAVSQILVVLLSAGPMRATYNPVYSHCPRTRPITYASPTIGNRKSPLARLGQPSSNEICWPRGLESAYFLRELAAPV
ncbi:uncharacterized protein TrAFT101_001767 [Trichoderma asperellum]|uniref:uncharacterized protein n=1 Tax=Trichoderma asperellum TaxID=101201 RepID=UPI003318C457|nr:hypothetical protein TrAFT101_001767 [Trichoderma asperellum]